MDEAELVRWYGRWQPWTPEQVSGLLDGWPHPWWIAGGHALDAFTRLTRDHSDIDVAVFRRDIPALRTHLATRYHCWAVGSGALRPLTVDEPQLPDWADQCWVREDAGAPWRVDVLANPDRDGAWVFRRDPTTVLPLDAVTWRDGNGTLFQRPEITLIWKAKHLRAKDDADLERTWPLLDHSARDWLRTTLARLHPDHPWLRRG
ncbi:MAG: nucleotidyltransferase domain-containing protein [Pseudonocardia sp.]|jgi:hypothetical protein